MKRPREMMQIMFARFLTVLPGSLAQFITLASHTRLGKWYHENKIYKFPPDTIIALRSSGSFGYGVRPVGIVRGYTNENAYVIEMTADLDGNFFDWMNGKYVPTDRRTTMLERHFKWNIEYHFKKVGTLNPDLAYA